MAIEDRHIRAVLAIPTRPCLCVECVVHFKFNTDTRRILTWQQQAATWLRDLADEADAEGLTDPAITEDRHKLADLLENQAKEEVV